MKTIATQTFVIIGGIILLLLLIGTGSFLISKGKEAGGNILDAIANIASNLGIFEPAEPTTVEKAVLCAYAICNYDWDNIPVKYQDLQFEGSIPFSGRGGRTYYKDFKTCGQAITLYRENGKTKEELCGDPFTQGKFSNRPIIIDLSGLTQKERQIDKKFIEQFTREIWCMNQEGQLKASTYVDYNFIKPSTQISSVSEKDREDCDLGGLLDNKLPSYNKAIIKPQRVKVWFDLDEASGFNFIEYIRVINIQPA